MMKLFSPDGGGGGGGGDGGCSPFLWLKHETVGSSPGPMLPERCVDDDEAPTTAFSSGPRYNTHINGLYRLLISV